MGLTIVLNPDQSERRMRSADQKSMIDFVSSGPTTPTSQTNERISPMELQGERITGKAREAERHKFGSNNQKHNQCRS